MNELDVIVIGAGHNGLVAAAYLAKAGHRVVVVEQRDHLGGAAATIEIFPGFRFSPCADGAGYLADEVRSDLRLESNGLEFIPSDVVAVSPLADGTQLTIWRSDTRTASEIERFSKADAQRFPVFAEQMRKYARVVGGLMRVTPPDLPDFSLADLRSLPALAGPVAGLGRKNLNGLLRVLPMPVADLLNEWFESDVVKAAIASSAVQNISWGPQEAGTAYTLLYNWALSGSGSFRSTGAIRGGMGGLSGAIANAARSLGVEIRTGTPVESILVENDRAVGVELPGGESLRASVVVSGADPRTTFTKLIEPARQSATFARHVRNVKYRGTAARILLALRGLPEFSSFDSGESVELMTGPIQIAPSIAYLQKAYDATKYGECATSPVLDIRVPSVADPSLAPAGQHVLSITAKFVPHQLRDDEWSSQRDRFTESVLDTLESFAPNIRDIIAHQRTWVPPDLESDFGLPEGNPNHGEMTLDQFFHMRPIPGCARYRMPLAGLYLCGAGTHPGGNVTGLPGRNAAREIARDLGSV